jgi:hypothetical protein
LEFVVRSIVIHLWQVNEDAVASALNTAVPMQARPWTFMVEDDPCLYIDFYHDGPIKHEDWSERFRSRSGPPSVSVIVDISGRHEGWPQAQQFTVWLLKQFDGIAEDDGAVRFWSREEIEQDKVIDGKRFGWWRNLT